MADRSESLVMIAVAHDEIEVNVWRDLLEKEGIATFIRSTDPLTSFGVAPLPGSLQVFVRARDQKRARWLLGDSAENPPG